MIRNFTPADLPAVSALQQAYTSTYPGTAVIPGEVYLSPGFHQGEDIFCAFDPSAPGEPRLLAYAPLYFQPSALGHTAWVEIKADPSRAETGPVKEALYQCLRQRVRQLVDAQPGDRLPVSMIFQYLPNEREAIQFVEALGFTRSASIYNMQRDLSAPLPDVPLPAGIDLRFWKMESEDEQRAYIAARNECFPEAPSLLEDWQYFLTSPMWAVGGSIAAFDGDTLVGNVAVYWNEAENAQSGVKAGYTEYIFVRPGWRGRGIASAMIAAALRFLRENGLAQARLEVRALNEGALNIYTSLGYRVVAESQFYERRLEETA